MSAVEDVRFPDEFNFANYCLFDRITEGRGNHRAILFGNRDWTYQQVADRALRVASYLVADGLHAEDRVAIVLSDVPPFAWCIFGVLAAGGILVMGNPQAPVMDIAHMLAYVKATTLITTQEVALALAGQSDVNLPQLQRIVLVADGASDDDPEADVDVQGASIKDLFSLRRGAAPTVLSLRAAMARDVVCASLPTTYRDDPCIWLFTSGSTGRPKAAMHTHRDFAFNTEVYAKRTIGYRADDITLSVPRLFFGYATGTNLWFPFAVGATVALFSERPTAESVSAAAVRYRPTIITNVPTMMGKLLDLDSERRSRGEPAIDLSSVRLQLSAGEALPPALLSRFRERFAADVYDGIGSAEMFHIYCSNRPGDVRPGSLGRVVDGYELRILPESASEPGAAPVATNDIGVLWVKGDSVALGYYQDRDRSWHTFHGHWCRTGDLFRIDNGGYLYLAGRADDLLKVGGVFVAPLEVEDCLLAHHAVSSVAVVAGTEDGLVKPMAIVCVRPESRARLLGAARTLLEQELKAHVQSRLSKHKYPRWILFVDELPKNDRGKVDRKRLAELAANGHLTEAMSS